MARIIIAALLLVFTSTSYLAAQNSEKMPESATGGSPLERLMYKFKHFTPDSFIIYGPNKDGKGWDEYEKHYFKYDQKGHPVFTEQYKLYDDGYRFKERDLDTYDPVTGKIRSHDVRTMEKKYLDSVGTHTKNMTLYDEQGRMVHYEELDGAPDYTWFVSNADSNVYTYNKAKLPVSMNSYNYSHFDKKWSFRMGYTADSADRKGVPTAITVSAMVKGGKIMPIMKYHAIKWAGGFNDFFDLDTTAKEYTIAQYKDKKWVDSLKKVIYYNPQKQIDSTVTFTIDNGATTPYNKDIFTYDDLPGHATEQHYVYLEKLWVLRSGKRRTVTIDKEHLAIEVVRETYEVDGETNKGAWSVTYKVVAH